MTTKKILLIIGGVVVALGFLVISFVGAIVGIGLYSINHSEAAARSRDFLRRNEKLQADIGPVKDFGSIVTGNISFHNGTGSATLHLKVIGEQKTVDATVDLAFSNSTWNVIEANYINPAGQTVSLLDPYDARMLIPRLAA
jgi:autotransporter translocation and assembly factor TamB